jgi:hypothetical protein
VAARRPAALDQSALTQHSVVVRRILPPVEKRLSGLSLHGFGQAGDAILLRLGQPLRLSHGFSRRLVMLYL